MEQSRQFIFNGLNLMSGSRSLVNALAELTAIFGDEPSGHDWLLGEFNQRLKTELFTQIDNTMSNKNNGSSIDQFAATLHFFNLIRQSFPNQQIGGGSEENEFNMEWWPPKISAFFDIFYTTIYLWSLFSLFFFFSFFIFICRSINSISYFWQQFFIFCLFNKWLLFSFIKLLFLMGFSIFYNVFLSTTWII